MTPKIEQWMRDAAEEIVRNIGAEDWDEGFHDSIAVIIASHAPSEALAELEAIISELRSQLDKANAAYVYKASEAAAQPTEEHVCKPSCHNPCLLDD